MLNVSLMLLLVGWPSSLTSDVLKKIHEGDSKDHVVEVLGEPEAFQHSDKDSQVTLYLYRKRSNICAIAFKEEKVVETACQKNPTYVSPGQAFGTILKGMGDGLSHASQNHTNVNCLSSTDPYGNTVTNCH